MSPWVLASRNAGKLRELRALFATNGIEVVDLREAGVAEDPEAEELIECFPTFAENALAKARWFGARLPGRTVVADDSGLWVDALGGEPGVRSKRWSGIVGDTRTVDTANNALLVERLQGIADRRARFVCAAAWFNGEMELVAEGEVRGRIVDAGRGDHGFGYDPHVFIDALGMTMAEATLAEKERVSHRGLAFAALLELVRRHSR